MNNPSHNGYPVNQEAFKAETPMQFADGQLASAFSQSGDVVAWGSHTLANMDPASQSPMAEAVVRTEQGPFYLKDGVITDVDESERQGRRISYDLRQPGQLEDIQIGGEWQIGSGWDGRLQGPVEVSGVVLRDGKPNAPASSNRYQAKTANPFDAAANRLAAVDQQEAQRKQRAAKVGPVVASVAVGSSTLRSAGRPPEPQRSYSRTGR